MFISWKIFPFLLQNRRAKEKRLKEEEIEKMRMNSRTLPLSTSLPSVIPSLMNLVKMDTSNSTTNSQSSLIKHLSLLGPSLSRMELPNVYSFPRSSSLPSSSISLAESLFKSSHNLHLFQPPMQHFSSPT